MQSKENMLDPAFLLVKEHFWIAHSYLNDTITSISSQVFSQTRVKWFISHYVLHIIPWK